MADSQNGTQLDLLTQEQLAALLDKSIAWCERSRYDGSGPAFVKIGRTPKYRRADVVAWIEGRKQRWTRQPMSQAA